jgi:hypothetical protein
VAGDENFSTIESTLKNAVDEFNLTLTHFGHGVGFRTFEIVEGEAFACV